MSDLFGNHIVGFPTRRLNMLYVLQSLIVSELFTEIQRAPGSETWVAMETILMNTAQYFLKNILNRKQ